MTGQNESKACCSFCGSWIIDEDLVQLLLSFKEAEEEHQTLFAHKKCLAERIHPSVPLHPELMD